MREIHTISGGGPNNNQSLTHREWLWVILAAVVTVIFRIATSDIRGFWMDEYQTLWAAELPMGDLIANRFAAAHSPLPFLWAKLFWLIGDGQVVLRASSAVACGIAVVGIALLAVELGGRAILPSLLVLCIVNPYWQLIGTMYRYMMPLVAVAILWAWLLARQMRQPTWGGGIAVAIVGGVTLWISGSAELIWFALLLFGIGEVWRMGVGNRGSRLWGLAAPMIAAVLSVIPFLIILSGTEHVSDFKPDFIGVMRGLKLMLETVFGDRDGPAALLGVSSDIFVALGLLVFVASIVLTFTRGCRDNDQRLNLFLLTTLLGMFLAVQVIAILFSNSVRTVRYQAFTSVPMMLLLASAWTGCRALPRLGYVFRGVLAALVLVSLVTMIVNRSDYHRETVRWLDREQRPAEPIYVIDPRELSMMEHVGFTPMDSVFTISEDESPENVRRDLRSVFEFVDVGFVMIYFTSGTEILDEALPPLMSEGFFVEKRRWHAGHMTVVAFARTEEGAERIRSMPNLREHRVIVPVH